MVEFASFWRRTAAYTLDIIAFSIMLLPLYVLEAIFIPEAADPSAMVKLVGIEVPAYYLSIFYMLLTTSIMSAFLASSWQATPGKRIMNIYVIKNNMTRLSFGRAFYRSSLPVIALIIMYFVIPLPFLAIVAFLIFAFWYGRVAFTAEKTTGHDLIAKTRVIVGRPQ